MKLNSKCMACQIRKQEAKIRHFNDEDRKKQYMEAIRQRFEHPKDDDCVPSISTEEILLFLLGRSYGRFHPDQQRI